MDAIFKYNDYQSNSINTSLHDILEEVLHLVYGKKTD
jgi:hypothetical protein